MCIDVVREMVDRWLDEMVGGDELRKECRLGQKVGHATVCGWLKQFGCVYTLMGKTFYVDGHEREEVVQSRHEFLAEFNKVQEAAPVWISLFWDKLDAPTQKHLIEHQLIHLQWQSGAGEAMVEVHVDSLGTGDEYVVFNAVRSACGPFGGGFSHGYVHEIPVETFHGENEMFDEESEAFEAMPTFFVVERVVTRASLALQALGEWHGDFVVLEICEDEHKLDAALALPGSKLLGKLCGKPVYIIGQDESMFKAYADTPREWQMGGEKCLQRKGEGIGEMVSAFQDDRRGFGFRMTKEELDLVNAHEI
jgi:hypothetical protein